MKKILKEASKKSAVGDADKQKISVQSKSIAGLPSTLAKFRRVARGSGLLWAATLTLDHFLPFGLMRFCMLKTVPVALLTEQIETILSAWGMPRDQASTTTGLILYADLHGIDSHGCNMLPGYHRDFISGRINTNPDIKVVRETKTTVLIDGGGGLGHAPARKAMEITLDKCHSTGLAAGAVCNSGHFGAAGAYAVMAANEGLIGIVTTSTHTPSVVPTFAAEAMLGTNPIAFAAPAADNPPFLLDMATSTVSLGKLMIAWRNGHSIAKGWALDSRGRPVRNGRLAAKLRLLTPLGGTPEMSSHKGYGLAAMVEILSSLLPGARTKRQGSGSRRGVGHFFLVIDPKCFRELAEFQTDLDEMIDNLHECKRARMKQAVMVAGDPERAVLEERKVSGIPLSRSLFEDIRYVSIASNVPFILEQEA